ncbi:HlyD family secretion protein [Sunxiuqinia dokdonensis]|uniref:Hemolysin secretion protein D n=1 Tax=Sunxiuqinia dokdonensis TaxID=1409788 RepID=A0A0L8VEX0_9BACT|nr:efflux RND transporter periplasmic adaptor subunit [Sunxiuqinia dokdonensis]KOH47025.1 hemolysin secretion protein D [Sunxiuqinia dokdonensis]
MNKTRNFIIGLFVTALLIFVLYTTWVITRPVPLEIQGEIEATQFRASSKIPGRIDAIAVHKGQQVQKGDFLFSIKSPEIEAKLQQATAARSAAEAQSMKAQHGAQEEDIQAAYSTYLKAEAAARLYEKTFQRISNLFEAGVVPEQKKDEVETQMEASRETANAAKAIWTKASNGARSEDKNAAEALVAQAEGAIAEVESYLSETQISAPASGEVSNIISEEGELVPTGFPVVTIHDLSDSWATFFIREDLMADIRMGSEIKATVPAIGNQEITFKVNYMSPLADFASWTSTKASGGFDVKSFEIHAAPVQPVDGLRPGMSVLINWKQFKTK